MSYKKIKTISNLSTSHIFLSIVQIRIVLSLEDLKSNYIFNNSNKLCSDVQLSELSNLYLRYFLINLLSNQNACVPLYYMQI